MIPRLDTLVRGLVNYGRRRGLDVRFDEARLASALHLAAELCRDRPEDEPAALLFALSQDARALGLGELWEGYPLLCAIFLARTDLKVSLEGLEGDVELSNLRLRIAWKLAGYEELRAFVAARMRPLG